MAGVGIPVKKIKKNSGSMMSNYWDEATRKKENLDPDIDKSKTKDNIWRMGSPDMNFPALVKAYADSQKDAKGRSIRSDAVVCMNAVIKPEAVYIDSLGKDEQIRLLDVAVDSFKELQGRERFKDGQCAIVYHFDEQGGHAHIFWLPVVFDKELQREKLSAKECCNKKWLNKVNHKLPGMIREAGFNIKDADCWDMDMSSEEKEALLERRKKKKSGRSSAQYKADKEKEIEQLEQRLEELDKRYADTTQIMDEVEPYERPAQVIRAFRDINANKTITGQIKLSQEDFNTLSEAIEASLDVVSENIRLENRLEELKGVSEELEKVRKRRDELIKEKNELKNQITELKDYEKFFKAVVEYLGDQFQDFIEWYEKRTQERAMQRKQEKDRQR